MFNIWGVKTHSMATLWAYERVIMFYGFKRDHPLSTIKRDKCKTDNDRVVFPTSARWKKDILAYWGDQNKGLSWSTGN